MSEVKDAAVVVADGVQVMELLRAVIDRGLNEDAVGALERLTALHERVTDRTAAREFASALADFQYVCPPVPKTRTAKVVSASKGTQFSYQFAPLDAIAEHVRPYLGSRGFSYSWDSQTTESAIKTTCTLRHENGHSESAEFTCPVDSGSRMNAMQQHAAALTYAKRQSLVQVLGITTADTDPDGGAGPELELIDGDQRAKIEDLIESSGADRAKFLRWLGVEQVSEIRKRDFLRARSALERKGGAS